MNKEVYIRLAIGIGRYLLSIISYRNIYVGTFLYKAMRAAGSKVTYNYIIINVNVLKGSDNGKIKI